MSYDIKKALYNANFKSLLNDVIGLINSNAGTLVISNPTLAIGTSSKAKIKNSAFVVVRDGIFYSISGGETAFTATSDDIADLSEVVFNVYLDASNVITLLKGTEVLTASAGDAECPATPVGGLKLGEVKIATSGAIFNATTDLLDAGHITDTYTNKTDVAPLISTYDSKMYLHQAGVKAILDSMVSTLIASGVTKVLSNPTLAIGTSDKTKIKHSAITVVKDGVFTTVPAGEVAFTATTHDITADGATAQDAIYLISLNSSNAVIITKGATADVGEAVAPALPANSTKIGEVLLSVASGATDFDATTDELDEGHITDTYTTEVDVLDDVVLTLEEKHYLYQKNLLDLFTDMIEELNVKNNNRVLGNPTLVIGSSSKAKVKNSAFGVVRDGTFATISSTETVFTATDDDVADGYRAIFLVYLASNNTITILKGASVLASETAVCPDVPTGGLKIGEVEVEADGAFFNASTDLLDVNTLEVAYRNTSASLQNFA